MTACRLGLGLALSSMLLAASADADPISFFRVVPLGVKGQPSALNERGAVTVNGADGVYLADGRSTIRIPEAAIATAVNNQGMVAGETLSVRPYRWSAGAMQVLQSQPGTAWGMNDQGTAVGVTYHQETLAATIWRGTDAQEIVPWAPVSMALAINNRGVVAGVIDDSQQGVDGSQAFTWSEQQGLQLIAPRTWALDLNDLGGVVGQAWSAEGAEVGFFFDPAAGVTTFSLPAGADRLVPSAINDNNWIVGDLFIPSADEERIPIPHGFVSVGTGTAMLLDDLIRGPIENGWSIAEARDINNKGQIAVTLLHPYKGFMAARLDPIEPVPEPAGMFLVGTGVALLGRKWKRGRRSI